LNELASGLQVTFDPFFLKSAGESADEARFAAPDELRGCAGYSAAPANAGRGYRRSRASGRTDVAGVGAASPRAMMVDET
jgi:hypothetical protein